jgi:hypothetical protein
MKDFALEPHTNKFLWEWNGLSMTDSYLQYMQQKVRAVLSLFKGEWYLNANVGLPYIPTDFNNDSHRSILETAIRVRIAGITGIKKLVSFETSFDQKTRLLSVKFIAQCENGETLEVNYQTLKGWA